MSSFSFDAILESHEDGPEGIAEQLYVLYDDVTVSSLNGIVCVRFELSAPNFSRAVQVANRRLAKAGYRIRKIEIDGKDLPMLSRVDET